MIASSIFVVFVVTLLVKYFLHMRRMERYVKHLPMHPPHYPIFGNSLSLIGKSQKELFNEVIGAVKTHGTPLKAYLGPFLMITIDKPEDFKHVLMSQYCLDKPYLYQFYPSPVGIFTIISSTVWRPIRRLINPSFNLKVLQTYLPIFNEKIRILLENLDREVAKPHFDIRPYMNECTLDMISATTMGYNVDVQRNKNREFLQSIEAFFEIVAERSIKFWTHFDFIYRFTDLHEKQQKHLFNLHTLSRHIYHLKKAEYMNENKDDLTGEKISEIPDKPYKTPQIMINHLFQLLFAGKMDEKTAQEEVETILVAGNETSALTVSYMILLVAMHPNVQERLFQELRTVFTSQDEDMIYEHMQQLPYLDQVIKEVLRLYPVGPFMVRRTTADIQLSNCVIPKNCYVTLSMFNLHRRPDIWGENADQFNPDNFLPENCEKRHPFAFLPFAAGPRNCIGYQYGMMALRTMLAGIFRRFKFTTNLKMEEFELVFQITLKLCNKHMVGIERREW